MYLQLNVRNRFKIAIFHQKNSLISLCFGNYQCVPVFWCVLVILRTADFIEFHVDFMFSCYLYNPVLRPRPHSTVWC